MKDFIFNTAKGKRFFVEINSFFVGNNIPADIDVYEYALIIRLEQDFIVDNDLLCAMMSFARRYDMLINIYADFNGIVIKFMLD